MSKKNVDIVYNLSAAANIPQIKKAYADMNNAINKKGIGQINIFNENSLKSIKSLLSSINGINVDKTMNNIVQSTNKNKTFETEINKVISNRLKLLDKIEEKTKDIKAAESEKKSKESNRKNAINSLFSSPEYLTKGGRTSKSAKSLASWASKTMQEISSPEQLRKSIENQVKGTNYKNIFQGSSGLNKFLESLIGNSSETEKGLTERIAKEKQELQKLITEFNRVAKNDNSLISTIKNTTDFINLSEKYSNVANTNIKATEKLGEAYKTLSEAQKQVKQTQEALNKTPDTTSWGDKIKNSKVGRVASDAKNIISDTWKNSGVKSFLSSELGRYASYTMIFSEVRQQVQKTIDDIKELDKAFSEIAMVTDKSMSDLWGQYSEYNTIAQELGQSTTDVIKASALYYQQGLEQKDVMTMTTDSMKLAVLAGEDYEAAVQQITSAIHGFNLENTDSHKIMDVYVNLAQNAAVSVETLGSAMNRTASIANTAGMSLEDTSAFIAKISSTTQEAAETTGTALRTMIARFTALKKDVSDIDFSEVGEDFDVNKVQTALQSAGIAVRDLNGETRDYTDIILDLSKKWNTLDKNTKQYIATQAAGTTQQSRFLALVSNYDELVDLMDIANNSTGAAEKQFSKYSDTVEYKLNSIRETWQSITQKFLNSEMFKSILDMVLKVLNRIDKIDFSKKFNIAGLITAATMLSKVIGNLQGKKGLSTKLGGYLGTKSAKKSFSSELKASSKEIKSIGSEFDSVSKSIETYKQKLNSTKAIITANNKAIKEFAENNNIDFHINPEQMKSEIENLVGSGQVKKEDADKVLSRLGSNDTQRKRVEQITEETKALQEQAKVLEEKYTSAQQKAQQAQTAFANRQAVVQSGTELLTSGLEQAAMAFFAYKSGAMSGTEALKSFGIAFAMTTTKVIAQTATQIAANTAASTSFKELAASEAAALAPLLAIALGIAAVVAVTAGLIALYKYFEKREKESKDSYKAAKNLEDAQKRLENAKTSKEEVDSRQQETKTELENTEKLRKEWEELSRINNLTEEQQERKNELAKEINESMPELVTYYNEETNELIVQNDLWDEKIKKLKEANDINTRNAHAATFASNMAEEDLIKAQTARDLTNYGIDYETAVKLSDKTDKVNATLSTLNKELYNEANNLINNFSSIRKDLETEYDNRPIDDESEYVKEEYVNRNISASLDEEFLKTFMKEYNITGKTEDIDWEKHINQFAEFFAKTDSELQKMIDLNQKRLNAQRESAITEEGSKIASDYETSQVLGRIVAASAKPDDEKTFDVPGYDAKFNIDKNVEQAEKELIQSILSVSAEEFENLDDEIIQSISILTGQQITSFEDWSNAVKDFSLDEQTFIDTLRSVESANAIPETLSTISDEDTEALKYFEEHFNNYTEEQASKLFSNLEKDYPNLESSIKEETERARKQFTELKTNLTGFVTDDFLNSTYGVLSQLNGQIQTVKEEMGTLAAQDYGKFVSEQTKGMTEEQLSAYLSMDWGSITTINAQQMREDWVKKMTEVGVSGAEALYDAAYQKQLSLGTVDLSIIDVEEFEKQIDEMIDKVDQLGDSFVSALKEMSSDGEVSFDTFLSIKEKLDESNLDYNDYFNIDDNGKITTTKAQLDALMKEQYSNIRNINQEQIKANEQKIEELNKQKQLILAQGTYTSGVNQTVKAIGNITQGYYLAAKQLEVLLNMQGQAPGNIKNYYNDVKKFSEANDTDFKQWQDQQVEQINTQIEQLEKTNKTLTEDANNNTKIAAAGLRDYSRNANEAVASTEKAADATSDLADKQEALNEKIKEFNEFIYGSKNRKSSLDYLYNYSEALSAFNDELSRSKDLLEDSKTVTDATTNLERYAQATHNLIAEEKAQQNVLKSGLSNYEKWLQTSYAYQNSETGDTINIHWADYIEKDNRTGKYMIDQRLIETAKFNDDLKELLETQVSNYNKYSEDLLKSEDNVRQAEKEIQDRRDEALKKYANMESELANALQAQYQTEVDELKSKYDAMKEADDDYVSALEEAINKQRELRDRENSYDDLAQKERRLSLMQRDTSGGNRADILGLEEEIQEDRETLLDEAVDNIIDGLSDLYESQQELRDTEIELKEALIDNTAYWNSEAERLALSFDSAEEYAQYLAQLSEEYADMTLAQQQAKLLEYQETYEQASEYMALQALDSTTTTGDYITEMLNVTETEVNDIVVSTAETFTTEVTRMADEVTTKFQEDMAKILEELNAAKEALQEVANSASDASGSMLTMSEVEDGDIVRNTPKTTNGNSSQSSSQSFSDARKDTIDKLLLRLGKNQRYVDNADDKTKLKYLSTYIGSNAAVGSAIKTAIKNTAEIHNMTAKDYLWQTLGGVSNFLTLDKYLQAYKFANGGLVDYTGPAWVDGSYNQPEAFLSAQDTERIGNAAKILSNIPWIDSISEASISNTAGDVNVEINLNIDSIDSEIDIDNMLNRMKEEIVSVATPIGSNVILQQK